MVHTSDVDVVDSARSLQYEQHAYAVHIMHMHSLLELLIGLYSLDLLQLCGAGGTGSPGPSGWGTLFYWATYTRVSKNPNRGIPGCPFSSLIKKLLQVLASSLQVCSECH